MSSTMDRHCAYCLISLPEKDVKICGKCHRRAYCSQKCQRADWTTRFPVDRSSQRGQGHKNWCGVKYGEEDLDWKVVSIPKKGLAIQALRKFPAKSVIMVDPCQFTAEAHPGAASLLPQNGTPMEIIALNALGCAPDDTDFIPAYGMLCIRLARVNHSCDPNAFHYYVNGLGVKTLVAERDILPNEEITISYIIRLADEFQLQKHYGITCPLTCACKNKEWRAARREIEELDQALPSLPRRQQARVAWKLLHNPYVFLLQRQRFLHYSYQVALAAGEKDKAKEYVEENLQLTNTIGHPLDTRAIRFQNILQHMS